jgi:hypothetical protein
MYKMDTLIKCSRCHSELLEEYFKKNRKGVFNKCCNTCLNRFHCDKCEFKTSTKRDLKRHIDAVHLHLKPFGCSDCEFKCALKGNLQKHINMVHLDLKTFECSECEFKTATKQNLQYHIDQIHLKHTSFECPDCEYKSVRDGNLQNHINAVHLNIRSFECDQCDYKCTNRINLQTHIDIIHLQLRPFECPICYENFSTNGNLQQHMKNCTGELKCSSGELAVTQVLDKLRIPYVFDQPYDDVKDKSHLRWDFRIISDEPIFIEYDGECHYFPIRYGGTSEEKAEKNLESSQRRDKIKDDYCNDNVFLLLRIPYWEKNNIDEIVTNFINTNLFIQQPLQT